MSKCNISISLDEPRREYTAGDVVRGKVHVQVHQDCKVNKLVVELRWDTHGMGNRTWDIAGATGLYRGHWHAGDTFEYPFEFTVPNGPITYHGHYLNVDWRLRATADIPWAVDPVGELDLLVVPGPQTDPTTYESTDGDHPGLSSKRAQNDGSLKRGQLLFSVPFWGAGLGMMLLSIFGEINGSPVFLFIFGAVFFLAGATVAYGALRNKFSSMKLGRITLAWPKHPLKPGEEVALTLHMNAIQNINLISSKLICRETVVSGSGTDQTTYTHEIFERELELTEVSRHKGRVSLEAIHQLPADAPPCFYGEDNELAWFLSVHIDISHWPDWLRDLHLDVRPSPVLAEASDTPAPAPAPHAPQAPAPRAPAAAEEKPAGDDDYQPSGAW